MFTEVRLLRGEEDPAGELSHLGALLRCCTALYCTVLHYTVLYCTRGLLRRKAEEGVRVLVLIWNDKSSGAATGREGMMG